MKIVVINLEKDIVRKKSIEGQLKHLRLSGEIHSAILGSEIPASELKKCYNKSKAMRTQCRPLTPSEIGCALSHINIYKCMIKRNIPYVLVLEDDVVLPDNLSKILNLVEPFIKKEIPQIILLSDAKIKAGEEQKIDDKYSLFKYKAGYYSSSYILNRHAAKTLLLELYPIGDVADCWKRLNNHKVVDINVIYPPLIIQNQESFGSSTTKDIIKNADNRFLAKLKFKICRAFWLGIDVFTAFYNRNFNPYKGL